MSKSYNTKLMKFAERLREAGQSEMSLIADHIENIVASFDEDMTAEKKRELIVSSLDELGECVKSAYFDLPTAQKRKS